MFLLSRTPTAILSVLCVSKADTTSLRCHCGPLSVLNTQNNNGYIDDRPNNTLRPQII